MKRYLIIAGLLVGGSGSWAQNIDFVNVDHKYVDKHGYPITGVYEVQSEDKTNMEVTISNGNLSGLAFFYYEDGNMKEYGNYNRGYRDGKWNLFSQSGDKIAEANYMDGQKHGVWYVWDANGNLRCKMKYHHGEKVGIWKSWDENGKLLMKRIY